MANLIGSGINQISVNGMLGNLAFQDKAYVSVDKVGIGSTFVDSGTAEQILQVYGGGAYVSGSVGIGTTIPTAKLDVIGNVRITGIATLGITTFTGAVSFGSSAYFGDNDSLNFGDGNDLQIYHDGSNSVIKDAGTGILVLGGTGAVQITNAGLNENLARFLADGAAELYFDNVKEFETTGYGATVFGTLQTQGLQVSGITTSSRLTLNGANDTATGGGQIYLNGATGNRIDFNTNGVGAPSFTTRSAGTKIVLYPAVSGSAVDFAFGIEGGTVLWNSTPQNNFVYAYRWYGGTTQLADLKGSGELVIGSTSLTGTASQALQVNSGAYVSDNVGVGTTNPTQSLHVQGNARVTGAIYDSTNSPGTSGQVLQSTVTGTQWATASGGGSGKFDTSIDNVIYVQPTGTLDIVGVGTTTTQITTLPAGSNKYLVHSIHVTNISNGDAEITAGFIINNKQVPATISVSVGSSGGSGIHTFTVGSASSITVGMAVTGTGNIGETTGIGSTAGFQFNTYVTSVDGNNITLSKPMSGRATGVLRFSPVSEVVSRLPVPVGSAVELLKQPMVLNALDSIVLQSTGAGTGIGSTSTAAISQTANSNFLTVTAGAAITNFIASGMLIQGTGSNTGIQTNTFVGVGYTPGALSIPMTRPATSTLASQILSFSEVVVPQDGALQATIVYQSTTDTSYLNGTGTVAGISSNTTSVTAGLSTIPVAYYGTGNLYPSTIQSIRVSNISDGSIYPGGDYPVWVGIGNSDTIFSWLAYNMIIPKNSSIELCEAPKRLGIGQSIFAYASTPYTIEIQVAGKQKTS